MESEAELMEKAMNENNVAGESTANRDVNTVRPISNSPDPNPFENDRNNPKPTEEKKMPKAVMRPPPDLPR
jgi:hypothetical protein